MISAIKTLMLTFLVLHCSLVFAQEQVTLTVNGNGKTTEQAQLIALRSAIEQAFGTFISSNTQIVNDELIKDEIVSLSSGTVSDFQVLSEIQLPDNTWSNTSSVTVSIKKLTSFCESRGITIEFKGGLFGANIKLNELAKKNEEKAINHLTETAILMFETSFDYSVANGNPEKVRDREGCSDCYKVPLEITVNFNKNINALIELTLSTLEGVSVRDSEKQFLAESGHKIYEIIAFNVAGEKLVYTLRSQDSFYWLLELFAVHVPARKIFDCEITNGIEKVTLVEVRNNRANNPNTTTKFHITSSSPQSNYWFAIKPRVSFYGGRPNNVYEKASSGLKKSLRYCDPDVFIGSDKVNNRLNDKIRSKFVGGGSPSRFGLDLSGDPTNILFTYELSDMRPLDEISEITAYAISPIVWDLSGETEMPESSSANTTTSDNDLNIAQSNNVSENEGTVETTADALANDSEPQVENVVSETEELLVEEIDNSKSVESEAIAPNSSDVQYYTIKDPDGWSNLRTAPGGEIIQKIYEGDRFEVVGYEGKYKKVKLSDGTVGFLHESRVVELSNAASVPQRSNSNSHGSW